MEKKKAIFLIVLSVLFFSCDGYTVKTLKSNTSQVQQDGLDTQSVLYFDYDEAKGSHSFTISPRSKKSGYTYWMDSGENVSSDFEGLRYKVRKKSGDESAFFGIIFFREEKDDKQNFDLCFINTQGEYLAGRITGGNFTYIIEKEEISSLYTGLNADNIIDVSFNSEKAEYEVSLNGVRAYSYSYEKEDFTGLCYGIAVVVPGEDAQAESVVFERLNP